MMTPEKAAKKFWEIHNELMGDCTPKPWPYLKAVAFSGVVAIMAKLLPQVTEDAVADDRARITDIVKKIPTAYLAEDSLKKEILKYIDTPSSFPFNEVTDEELESDWRGSERLQRDSEESSHPEEGAH